MRTLTQWLNYQKLELVATQTSIKIMQLAAYEVWKARAVPKLKVTCERGIVWLTQSGDPLDYILHPGQSFLPTCRGKVVVQALTQATISTNDRSNEPALLSRAWQHLVTVFHRRPELHIWQSLDRFGNTWWHACDPATGKSTQLASEVEMRLWVEQRYYKGVG